MKAKRRILPRADINVTPFIDILLVLLVIFMTITPLTPTGLRTHIPQPPPMSPLQEEAERTIVLSVDRNGVFRINQTEIDAVHLIGRLEEIFKTRQDHTIFLQADEELLFNEVAQVIDAAKGAGADRIGLMTERIAAR